MKNLASSKMLLTTKLLIAAAMGVGLAACSHISTPQTPEEVVKQRSTEFWNYRINDRVAEAYAYTPPAYRKLNDIDRFRTEYGGKPMAISREIVNVDCKVEAKRCTVKQKFIAKLPMTGNVEIPVYDEEIWLEDEGQWWIYRK